MTIVTIRITSKDGNLSLLTLSCQKDYAAPPGRGPVEVTDNIPKAHNSGFEIDAVVLATDALTIGGNFSYTESVYDVEYTIFNEGDPRTQGQ